MRKRKGACITGCLTIVGALFALLSIGPCVGNKDEQEQLSEEQRQKMLAEEAARRKEQSKEEKIRTFALNEIPSVWEEYQTLQSEIRVQQNNILELRRTLTTFGINPDDDSDYKRICAQRDEMIKSIKDLRVKLEDAYIAFRKYEAKPTNKDYRALMRKAIEDGIQEADAAAARFKEMRMTK